MGVCTQPHAQKKQPIDVNPSMQWLCIRSWLARTACSKRNVEDPDFFLLLLLLLFFFFCWGIYAVNNTGNFYWKSYINCHSSFRFLLNAFWLYLSCRLTAMNRLLWVECRQWIQKSTSLCAVNTRWSTFSMIRRLKSVFWGLLGSFTTLFNTLYVCL